MCERNERSHLTKKEQKEALIFLYILSFLKVVFLKMLNEYGLAAAEMLNGFSEFSLGNMIRRKTAKRYAKLFLRFQYFSLLENTTKIFPFRQIFCCVIDPSHSNTNPPPGAVGENEQCSRGVFLSSTHFSRCPLSLPPDQAKGDLKLF